MQIWFNNVPHTKLAVVKGHQNWVKVTGEYLTFPGGGTQFTHGALHYIDYIQKVSISNFSLLPYCHSVHMFLCINSYSSGVFPHFSFLFPFLGG